MPQNSFLEVCLNGVKEKDLLIGLLTEWPFDSFQEHDDAVSAFIQEIHWDSSFESQIKDRLNTYFRELSIRVIKAENWNEIWEKSFDPVIVGEFCTIKADFHDLVPKTAITINIQPKMAFGTGHHETTWMMIRAMKSLDFSGKRVLDYGTGTGILAILSEQLGAQRIEAIDYDEHAINNALENGKKNRCQKISFNQAELSELKLADQYDIILANINVPVLIENAEYLVEILAKHGFLLLSGILKSRKKRIISLYNTYDLLIKEQYEKGEWTCLLFTQRL